MHPRKKRSRWFKPKQMTKISNWLQEVRAFQKSLDLLIPRRSLIHLIQELTQKLETSNALNIRYQSEAIKAIQSAAEQHLVTCFEKLYLVMLHTKRVTLQQKDMQLIDHFEQM